MQGGTVSLRLSVREVEPDFSFFTTDWESGSNFKQYSHVTNILSYQGLNMFLINS